MLFRVGLVMLAVNESFAAFFPLIVVLFKLVVVLQLIGLQRLEPRDLFLGKLPVFIGDLALLFNGLELPDLGVAFQVVPGLQILELVWDAFVVLTHVFFRFRLGVIQAGQQRDGLHVPIGFVGRHFGLLKRVALLFHDHL